MRRSPPGEVYEAVGADEGELIEVEIVGGSHATPSRFHRSRVGPVEGR